MTPETQPDATTLRLTSILSSLDAELSTSPRDPVVAPAFAGAQPLNLSTIDLVEADGLQGVGGAIRLADVAMPEYPDHLGPIDAGEHAALELLFKASRVPGPRLDEQTDSVLSQMPDSDPDTSFMGNTDASMLAFDETHGHSDVCNSRPPRNRPELASVEEAVSSVRYDQVDATEAFVDFNNDVYPGRNTVPSGVYLLRHGARVHSLGEDSRGRFILGSTYRLADNASQGSRMCVAFDALSVYAFSDKLLLNTEDAYTFLSYYDQSTGQTIVVRVLISDIESVQAAPNASVIQWFRSGSVKSALGLHAKLTRGNKRKSSGLVVPLLLVECSESSPTVEPMEPTSAVRSPCNIASSACKHEDVSLLDAIAGLLQNDFVSRDYDPQLTSDLCSCLRSISSLERELHAQRHTVAVLLSTLGRRA